MLSTLDLHPSAARIEDPIEKPVEEFPVEHFNEEPQESAEFEIVMGRRHVASALFVATVAIVLSCTVSYLAGKSLSTKKTVVVEKIVPIPAPAVSTPAVKTEAVPEPPLFAEPVTGAIYLQMGAVEEGIAVIFAEGLRKRGLQSFVATGPNEKIFRVLIGPFPDQAAYQRAKDSVTEIGLATFARRFPN
jgi:cell division septation protein DedD